MANLDSNQWYMLYMNEREDENSYLLGTGLFWKNSTVGAVLFQNNKLDSASYKWQFFPINSTTYVIRTGESGSNGFLHAPFDPTVTNVGRTNAGMVRGNVSDSSVYWNVAPWGNGTFYLTNAANGTAWHLSKNDNAGVWMTSNITAPQPRQQWVFKAVSSINNLAFSTVNLPSSTVTTPASVSPTVSATSSQTGTPTNAPLFPQNTSAASGGLSTGAKAGIGIGVGIVALIALVVLALWFKRRRQTRHYTAHSPPQYNGVAQVYAHELHHENAKHELYHENPKHEVAAVQHDPVELPSTGVYLGPKAR